MKEEIKKCEFYVDGMHCAACELFIENKLSEIDGIKKVDADLGSGKVYIESSKPLGNDYLNSYLKDSAYRIVSEKSSGEKINWKDLGIAFIIASALAGLFLLVQKLGIVNLVNADKVTLPFVFFIGVVASLSSCMAVVGGLVLSLSSSYAKGHKFKPLVAFHISRIVGFFILGGVIGVLGKAFVLTSTLSFALNIALFIVMLIMGANLLEMLPGVKKLQVKMPKFLGKGVLKVGESGSPVAPIILGAATFVLPCGFTQSMQIYSLTTGSFINGAITMLVFALGTFPVLGLISFASVKFSKGLQSKLFFKISGFIVIFFAMFNFISALVAIGLIKPIFNI